MSRYTVGSSDDYYDDSRRNENGELPEEGDDD